MTIDYGTELSWTDDVDPTHRFVTGTRLLGEALYRRLITPRGQLLDDPDYGLGIVQLLNKPMTTREIASLPARIQAECLKDERVASVTATVTRTGEIWKISLVATASSGEPFRLVMSVDQVTPALLEAA